MKILPPAQTPVLIGHDETLEEFEAAFASGRMAHAWLLTGIEGIGKTTFAWHAAHHVLSNGQNKPGSLNLQHPTARLVANEAHPDLFVLRRPVDEKTGRTKDVIPAEEARGLASFFGMSASHGGWRVAILEEAHALNRFGQNAILKIIEEPPPKSLILMTATTPGALLPTIRSRCRVLPLLPLNEVSLRVVLARCGLDVPPEEMERLISYAGGSAGFALRMAESEALPLFEELLGMIRGLPLLDMAKLHALADRIGRKGEADSFNVMAQLLTETLRRDVKAVAAGNQERILPLPSLHRALDVWDKTRRTLEMAVESSLDRKLAFVNAVAELKHT